MIVPATAKAIAEAADLLQAGELVAFPTETVYGLGAAAISGLAVAKIYETKGRPRFNPLIVHVAEKANAEDFALFDQRAHLLAEVFWPGPLTLVLPRRHDAKLAISDLVTAGLPTIAVRMPNHAVAKALLEVAQIPLAAPSANRSGHVSPTLAQHVYDDFQERSPFILDGGPTQRGLESTIIGLDADGATFLRAGAISREDLSAVLKEDLRAAAPSTIQAPGQLESHYAPAAKVRLNTQHVDIGEVLLAFGPDAPAHAALNLSPSGNLREAAANLFAYLRKLDSQGPTAIAVMPIPKTGLGEAINDRLRRATSPR